MKEKEEVFWWNVRKGDFCWITVKSDFCEIWLLGMCCEKNKKRLCKKWKFLVERENLLCETDKLQRKRKVDKKSWQESDKKMTRTVDECVSWQKGQTSILWDIAIDCKKSCQQENFLLKWQKYSCENTSTTGIEWKSGFINNSVILASILKKEKMKICCKNVTRNCQFATKYPCIVDSISFGYNKHKSCPKLRISHNIFV